MAKTLTKRSSASDKKPLLSEAEVTKRVADAYKNPGGWVHYKLAFFFLLLCAAAGGCLYKATQLQEGIQVSWDAYDHHCHDHPDPSMDCAHHLIHIRTDETMLENLTKAGYGTSFLAAVCLFFLLTQSKEELNSKLL